MLNKLIKTYSSIREMAREEKSAQDTVSKSLKDGTLFRNVWILKKSGGK